MIINQQRQNGIGIDVPGRQNIVWGIGDTEEEIKSGMDIPIINVPDGAISVKRVFTRKEVGKAIVEFRTTIREYFLESNGATMSLGVLLSVREK